MYEKIIKFILHYMDKLEKYASKIVKELLQLEEGEDLCINSENEFLYFARKVKDAALKATHRPVTFVITSNGKPSGLAPYDPQDYTAPKSKGRVMLHLERPRTLASPATDFDAVSQDMSSMMEYGHLAEPVYLDRRIAVPWCSVPCFDETDNDSWNRTLNSYLFAEDRIHFKHIRRCEALNRLHLRILHITGKGTDLTLELDEESHFIGKHVTLPSERAFFSGLQTDELSINLCRSCCSGKANASAMIMGNALDADLEIRDGIIVPDPRDYSQRLLSRFFLLEDNLDCISVLTITENKLRLSTGSNLLESLNEIPTRETDLTEDFIRTDFKLELEVQYSRIEAQADDGTQILLENGGQLLL